MTVTVPLELNGIDVEQVLQDLIAVTGIVARNRKLEDKYSGLKKAGEIYQNTLQNAQNEVNIKIKKAGDNYRLAEEKYKTLEIIKESA
jgi:transposase-like protein